MKPINFERSNGMLLGGPAWKYHTQGNVLNLPVWKNGTVIVSCWKATWRERLSTLFFGRIWLRVSAKSTHAPVSVEGAKTIFQAPPPEGQENE